MSDLEAGLTVLQPHTDHPRLFQQNKFVYPVLARRSRGLSVGINLNPDKVCNFDCIYCQVDRRSAATTRFVELDRMLRELEETLDLIDSGVLYRHERFAAIPEPLRRLNDIAFSGDGEPTTFRNVPGIVAAVADIKRRRRLDTVKLVMITNASMFHRPQVQAALETLDANQGEIWAKLDAGTAAYFQQIERTSVPFDRIVRNLHAAALVRPLVIQSLFLRVEGVGPPVEEIAAYCDLLTAIQDHGGALDRVQVYTVARPPAEGSVTPLSPEEVDAIAAAVRSRVQVPVEAYYGASS